MEKKHFEGATVASTAVIVGDVELGKGANIWYGAVLRGDHGKIVIGENTNVQDNCVIHEETTVGKNSTVGHTAILHGCTIGSNVMVGMGAIVLNGAVIGDNCIIGAGSVVTGKMNAPAGSLILGNPAKVVKELSPAQAKTVSDGVELYLNLAKAME